MSDLMIYSVSDKYIDFLYNNPKLQRFIFDNKKSNRVHTRKYLGAVMVINGLSYFIPFSSAKPTDFIINPDGSRIIRKSTPTIIRMTAENDATGELELKGTLKINNMIPVPSQELVFYDISAENDAAYKDLMQKEYTYIKAHKNDIIKSAGIVYSQQCVREQLLDRDPHTLSDNERRILNKSPNYLNFTVPFSYAENQCLLYIQSLSIGV